MAPGGGGNRIVFELVQSCPDRDDARFGWLETSRSERIERVRRERRLARAFRQSGYTGLIAWNATARMAEASLAARRRRRFLISQIPRGTSRVPIRRLSGPSGAGKKAMPAMKRKLARTDVCQLVALVRAFQGGKQHIAEVPEKSTQVKPRTEFVRVGSLMGSGDGVARSRTAGIFPSRKAEFDEATAYYQRFCARCHGSTGDGLAMRDSFRTIPDFTSRDWHAQRTEGRLKVSILDAKARRCHPSRAGWMRACAIRLVAYVRSLAGLSASSDPCLSAILTGGSRR